MSREGRIRAGKRRVPRPDAQDGCCRSRRGNLPTSMVALLADMLPMGAEGMPNAAMGLPLVGPVGACRRVKAA
jgi:hypothetical protein